MILKDQQTTAAFRCPACGAGVMSAVSLYALRGSMVRLRCTCGKSFLQIEPAGDGNLRLTVPCVICPQPHRFTVSEKLFFDSELFLLPCPYSDLNVCAIGEINHVKAELARTELQLLDLMEQYGVADYSALHREAEQHISDPQVREIVLFVIKDLDEEGKINCRCKTGEKREYDVEILPTGVQVTCRGCGARKLIPTDSLLDATDFLNCDSLTLE